jgi:hypothetical protein
MMTPPMPADFAPDAAPSPDVGLRAEPSPDRADAPVSETAERFLRSIVARVPLDQIEELHLFSPLRQGQVETGIAVLAVRASLPVVAETVPELPLLDDLDREVPIERAAEPPAAGDADAGVAVDAVDAECRVDAEAGADADVEVEPLVRHTVYTAHYRLVVKGPERGKWEADLVAEADAPLLTVETVVRGVQRRAGEDSVTVRYTAAQVARALRLPPVEPWPTALSDRA